MDKLSRDNFDKDDSDHEKDDKIAQLPILSYEKEIIEIVRENQIVIIQGQTGCGKTTKIPQFLLDGKLIEKGMIGITQPRKIAAVSMGKRVAKERKCAVGKEVGYAIRFDKKSSASTKIKYMTDGVLLNEIVTNPTLTDYSVIMIDEAHERTVNTDVLLGLLKHVSSNRDNLKILITSATISVEKFSKYFNDAKILRIEGRLFPVEVIYNGYCSDYINKTYQIVQEIHMGYDKGDILVFLTGEEEIEECCSCLKGIDDLVVLPLYGAIDFDSQQSIFDPVKPSERKVVVATNIAETSITIEGIRFVIDCGYVKQNNFISSRGIDLLESVKISKAQAEQRKGRAGREGPGKCYRLYERNMYDDMDEESRPEIYRKNLSEVYLKLLEFKVNPKGFDFLDKPNIEELERSKQELLDLSIINLENQLTGLGTQLVDMPVEPCLGKVIIVSLNNQCTSDIIKIISMLSERIIFKRPRRYREKADIQRRTLEDPDGDHFTYLRVFNEFQKLNSSNSKQNVLKEWCHKYFIDLNAMKTVYKSFKQICGIVKKKKIFNDTQSDRIPIKKAIISGYFKNICVKYTRDAYIRLVDKETMYIHPSSSLFRSSPKIILFHEIRKTNKSYVHGVLRLDEEILQHFPIEKKIIKFSTDLSELSIF